MTSADALYKIALSMVPGIGPVNARTLVSYCGGVEAIFKEKKRALLKIQGIGEALADALLQTQVYDAAQKQLDYLLANDARLLFFLDQDYPERLKRIKDSPILLYAKGNGNLNPKRSLAIVGTRKPTSEGRAITEEIVSGLTGCEVQIISGLAYGIDITAHRSCIQHGISTIGVMGTGLDQIYPAAHKGTARSMQELGAVLSEFPINSKADAVHFPMRNRIIAGMCDAILVIESAIKGGSMITAQMAIDYQKDLFAIPGRVQDTYSKGCNYLIKHQKAQLIESAEELATYMQWDGTKETKVIQQSLFLELDEAEQKVTAALSADIEISIDKLLQTLEWTPSKVASVLLNLEFKGLVRCLPGKRYILAH
jgi:DNA processing protein